MSEEIYSPAADLLADLFALAHNFDEFSDVAKGLRLDNATGFSIEKELKINTRPNKPIMALPNTLIHKQLVVKVGMVRLFITNPLVDNKRPEYIAALKARAKGCLALDLATKEWKEPKPGLVMLYAEEVTE